MVGCSNSCSTNSNGESALTARSRRPALVRESSARRSPGGSGGERASGARICATMGTNSSCQRRSVALAEFGERRDGPPDIGPPFARAAVAGDERDVELGLDQAHAMPLELEIGVPGHGGNRAQEEGVGVMEEAARVCERAQAAACRRAALDGKR